MWRLVLSNLILQLLFVAVNQHFRVTSADALLPRNVLPRKPSFGTLSVGSQPAVDSLLANEPNCSRWIWGQCYFTNGFCGEGRQHATRSGEGCRIIGITSRCEKPCNPEPQQHYFPNGDSSKHIWGIEEENGKDKNKLDYLEPDNSWDSPKANELQYEDNRPDDFIVKDGGEHDFGADDGTHSSRNGLNSNGDEDSGDSHCRWEKAVWSKCKGGYKTRVRNLRKNRGESLGKSCPSVKRDVKTCKSSADLLTAGGETENEKVVSSGGVSVCKWDPESRVCQKCDKGTQQCTMSLLTGSALKCGPERKFKQSCTQ